MESDRLILRPFTEEAFHEVKKMAEKEAMVYFGHDTYSEVEKTLERLHYRMFECSDRFRSWYILEKESGSVIGDIGLHAWEKKHDRAEIGYMLHPLARGKGYATEAGELIIKYGFEVLKLNRVEAFTAPENLLSQNVLKKLGFSHEGLKRSHYNSERYGDH